MKSEVKNFKTKDNFYTFFADKKDELLSKLDISNKQLIEMTQKKFDELYQNTRLLNFYYSICDEIDDKKVNFVMCCGIKWFIKIVK